MAESRSIVLDFTYSKQEIMQAFRLHYKKLLNIKRDLFIGFALLAVCVFLSSRFGFSSLLYFLLFLSGILLLLPLFAFYILPLLKFNQNQKWAFPFSFRFAEQLEIKNRDASENLSWQKFYDVVEDEHFFLIYSDTNIFLIIPKRVFKTLNHQAAFRELLKSKIRGFSG